MAQTTRTAAPVVSGVTFTPQVNYRTRAAKYTILSFADGFTAGYTAGLAAGELIGSNDTNFPVLTIISPTPGTNPGAAGGFPADLFSARTTPIIMTVTDITSGSTPAGLADVVVMATFLNYPVRGGQITEVVYRRGQFVGNYIQGSTQVAITNGSQLTCARVGGWPVASGTLGDIVFSCDALDKAGNLT